MSLGRSVSPWATTHPPSTSSLCQARQPKPHSATHPAPPTRVVFFSLFLLLSFFQTRVRWLYILNITRDKSTAIPQNFGNLSQNESAMYGTVLYCALHHFSQGCGPGIYLSQGRSFFFFCALWQWGKKFLLPSICRS